MKKVALYYLHVISPENMYHPMVAIFQNSGIRAKEIKILIYPIKNNGEKYE